jgi:hypothetical protein
MKDTTKHPDWQSLLDWVENRLAEAKAQQVRRHLNIPCAACQAEIEAIQNLLEVLGHERLQSPPAASQQRVLQLFRHFHQRSRGDERPRLIAHLIHDSWRAPAALAMRGRGRERQFLYSIEGRDIDLQVNEENEPDSLRLLGQVMPAVHACPVHLTQGETSVGHTSTDDLGNFDFRGLTPGQYELWFDLADAQIWIPNLKLATRNI